MVDALNLLNSLEHYGLQHGSNDNNYLNAPEASSFNSGNNNSPGGFDIGSMDNWAQGASALSNIMGAYFGMKQYGLAKKGLNHQIGLDNANFNNQYTSLTNQLTDLRERRRLDSSTGNTGYDPKNFGSLDYQNLAANQRSI